MSLCGKWRICIWLLLTTLLTIVPLAMASFETTGYGARAAVLGAAYATVANDIYSINQNPAGLVYLKRKEFSGTYALLHPGLDDGSKISNSFVAYGQPIDPNIGAVGFAFSQSSVQGLYRERFSSVGYAKRLKQRWAVGGVARYLFRSFGIPEGRTSNNGVTDPSATDPAFSDGDSRWNIGFDLGVLYRPAYNYSFGFAIENINEPNMAISDDDHDPLPMILRGGMAYSNGPLNLMTALESRKSASGIDRDINFTMAGENWWAGKAFANGDLAFRGSLGFGSRGFAQMATGLSMRLRSMQIDYGFVMPLRGATLGTTQGNHRFTFTLRFGQVIVEPDYEVRMRSAEIDLKKVEKKLDLSQRKVQKMISEIEELKTNQRKIVHQTPKPPAPPNLKVLSAELAESMERYWKRKSEGASNQERIRLLKQILNRFRGYDLNLSDANNEMKKIKKEREAAQSDLSVSWNYYRKIVERGTSSPERILLLNTMMERFKKSGVDLTDVKNEMDSLKSR